MVKTIVIGFDGASLDFIEPMIESGKLPAFKQMMENGAYGSLESTVPPVTIPAWPSIFSGKGPGKLNAFDFRYMTREYSIKYHNLATMKCRYVWDIMKDSGKSAAVINVPGTWPIYPIKGYMISGMLTPPGKSYSFPEELQDIIEKIVPGYSTSLLEHSNKIKSSYDTFKKRCAVLDWFLPKLDNELDAIFMVFRVPDVLSHAREVDQLELEKCYERIDEKLGQILESASGKNIIVISDHGYMFSKTPMFFINAWLEKNGYFFHRNESAKGKSKMVLFLRKAVSGKKRMKIAKQFLKRSGWTPQLFLPIEGANIDTNKTLAFSYNVTTSQYCGIWLNTPESFRDGTVDKEKYSALREEIINKLESEKLVEKVFRKEELYKQYGDAMPDIVIKTYGLVSTDISSSVESSFKGCHSKNGIIFAMGPDIAKKKIAGAGNVDIAPTILHMMGLDIPTDIDGKVLIDIFKKESNALKTSPKYELQNKEKDIKIDNSKEDEQKIKERLKELGYM